MSSAEWKQFGPGITAPSGTRYHELDAEKAGGQS